VWCTVLDGVLGWVSRAGHGDYAIVFLGAMLASAVMQALFAPGKALVLEASILGGGRIRGRRSDQGGRCG